jgi:hypothetical protein
VREGVWPSSNTVTLRPIIVGTLQLRDDSGDAFHQKPLTLDPARCDGQAQRAAFNTTPVPGRQAYAAELTDCRRSPFSRRVACHRRRLASALRSLPHAAVHAITFLLRPLNMSAHHRTYKWITRAIPAWSVCFIATILIFSFLVNPYGKGTPGKRHGAATPWQLVLSLYTVALHILSIVFPARVFLALGDVIKHVREVAEQKESPKSRKTQVIRTEKGSETFPLPVFVIILPAYKEEMNTLEETLRVLAWHPQARHSYHVRIRCRACLIQWFWTA